MMLEVFFIMFSTTDGTTVADKRLLLLMKGTNVCWLLHVEVRRRMLS